MVWAGPEREELQCVSALYFWRAYEFPRLPSAIKGQSKPRLPPGGSCLAQRFGWHGKDPCAHRTRLSPAASAGRQPGKYPLSHPRESGRRGNGGTHPEPPGCMGADGRSEEHTSELQSLMRNSYAVFCLNKKIYRDND